MNHGSPKEISNSPAQSSTTDAPTVIREHVSEVSSATVISEHASEDSSATVILEHASEDSSATVILEHAIEDSSATVTSEPPFLFTTADAPIVQIPRPPLVVPFTDYSCHWIERFYLCYANDSRYCVIVYGGRPESECVLAQISDHVPQATEAEYFIKRFCSQKQLLDFVGLGC